VTEELVAESTELLQQLIRNACVNDGTVESGHEVRSVETIAAFLSGSGLECERYEPKPGRVSLVARMDGSDPNAPSLHLMGHTDVVPANAATWKRAPFGGEVVDGEVWGRGAIDMLSYTATMAVAVRRLARSGFRPRGTLLYSAVADEEAQGTWGARWLVDNRWDDVRSDYLITEVGGARFPIARGGPKIPAAVAEKGSHSVRLRVAGTPGHGSMPYASDNAVVKAGDLVRRIAAYRAPRRFTETWHRFVDGIEVPAPLRAALQNATLFDAALPRLPRGVARMFDAATHTTFSPNILRGGIKTNVIADSAEVVIDIRTMPGDEGPEVRKMLADAAGELWSSVEILEEGDNPATESPTATPLWDALQRTTAALIPGARVVPYLMFGATDARFFRRKGVTAYGYAIFSGRISYDEFSAMFHGNDERVDQESLGLSAQLYERIARDLLG
jgi:acetylornithine deacetylase/succinyl-diaminopimelate desuccinylase-like protein